MFKGCSGGAAIRATCIAALRVAMAALTATSADGMAQTETARAALATRPGWEIGLQGAQYRYEEPGFMKLTGNRGGLTAAYTFTNARGAFSRIDVRESYGRLKYESTGTGSASSIPDLIVEGRVVTGWDFFAGQGFSFSPYAGAGYRYLYNDLRGYTSTGAAGYRRESNYIYAPLGFTARVHLGSRWVLAPTLETDIFVQGRQKTRLSDAKVGVHDVINSQGSGRGYRGALTIEKDHWALGAWTHYWRIGDSDVKSIGAGLAGLEPRNRTRESGLEIRYRF
jgi:hypothetical protein